MKYKEHEIQKAIVRALRYMYAHSVLFSIPNEGKRTTGFAAALKASGMMHGTADLLFLHEGLVIFIEVKSERGRQTEFQKEFQEKVQKQGHRYWLVKSLDEVLTSIENLNLLK